MKKVEVKTVEQVQGEKVDYRIHYINLEVDTELQFLAADTIDAVSIALLGTLNRTPIARRMMLGWIEQAGIMQKVPAFLEAYNGLAEKFPATYNDCRPILPTKDPELTPAVIDKVAELVALDYAALQKQGQFPFRRNTTAEGSEAKPKIVHLPFKKIW